MSQEEKVDAKATLKTEISNNKKNDKQELELDELVGKLSIEGTPQVSQKLSKEEKHAHQLEADSRSIFVGNITPDVTPEQIEDHFKDCGQIKRITLLYDRNTGTPKGYGYIEFESPAYREKALQLNGGELKGKKIAVSRKRTNIPGFNRHYNSQNQYFQQWQWNYPLMAYPNPDTFLITHRTLQISLQIKISDIIRTIIIGVLTITRIEPSKKNTSTVPKTLQKILDLLPQNLLSCRLTTLKVLPKKKIRNKHKAFMCILNNN